MTYHSKQSAMLSRKNLVFHLFVSVFPIKMVEFVRHARGMIDLKSRSKSRTVIVNWVNVNLKWLGLLNSHHCL